MGEGKRAVVGSHEYISRGQSPSEMADQDPRSPEGGPTEGTQRTQGHDISTKDWRLQMRRGYTRGSLGLNPRDKTSLFQCCFKGTSVLP